MNVLQTTGGFTLFELLVVVVIIGILAAVLIPAILNARAKANDTAAVTIAQRVATVAAAVQVNNVGNGLPNCNFAAPNVAVSSGSETMVVPSSRPVTNVICARNPATNNLDVTIVYNGGTQPNVVATIEQ